MSVPRFISWTASCRSLMYAGSARGILTLKIVPFLSLASGGGVHGSGANISGLYLVVVTMMNFFSTLWADTECFNIFSFQAYILGQFQHWYFTRSSVWKLCLCLLREVEDEKVLLQAAQVNVFIFTG